MVSVGFFVGEANTPGFLKCFNFMLMREEDYLTDTVAACGSGKITELNKNKVMSSIRDLAVYNPIPPAQLFNVYGVPTDPGTEVVFEEERYWIVQCEGDVALIEDIHGQQKEVTLDHLEKGRVTNTNAWNYRKGEIFETGFEADGAAQVFSGQWVWITARDGLLEANTTTHELAVVWNIQHEGAHVFNAIDGDLVVVDDVWPVSKNLSEVFNLNKQFVRFRNAAVEGENTNMYLLGRDQLLACIGQSEDAQMDFPRPGVEPVRIVSRKPVDKGTVGNEFGRTREDDAISIAREGDTPYGEVLGHFGEVTGDDFQAPISGRAGGDSNFIYLAMGAGALFLLYSVNN